MITLITGLPGAGKTLYAISTVKAEAERDGREVYYHGINDLKLPWIEHDATQWMSLPPKSIIVIDEIQRLMRPRANGSTPPPFVAELETHRHRGIDLVFTTQHPMLLDQNARRLVGRHLHIVRKFGTQHATVHEWASAKEGCDKSRTDSIKHQFKYPKDAFHWYKSAEAHTVKRRIPFKVYMLIAMPLLALALGGYAVWRGLHPAGDKPSHGVASMHSGAPVSPVGQGAGARGGAAPLTQGQYVEQFAPRVAGLAYTAPVYDGITKPVRAPFPAACVRSAQRCSCYSQQGTALDVPKPLCESIVAGGFFVPWDEREPPEARHQAIERLESAGVRSTDSPPGLVSLGGPGAELARLRNQQAEK